MPCRGDLKIAVLINEVGTIDVDSLLVNLKQVTAGCHSYKPAVMKIRVM